MALRCKRLRLQGPSRLPIQCTVVRLCPPVVRVTLLPARDHNLRRVTCNAVNLQLLLPCFIQSILSYGTLPPSGGKGCYSDDLRWNSFLLRLLEVWVAHEVIMEVSAAPVGRPKVRSSVSELRPSSRSFHKKSNAFHLQLSNPQAIFGMHASLHWLPSPRGTSYESQRMLGFFEANA